jgi:hypothetical protein
MAFSSAIAANASAVGTSATSAQRESPKRAGNFLVTGERGVDHFVRDLLLLGVREGRRHRALGNAGGVRAQEVIRPDEERIANLAVARIHRHDRHDGLERDLEDQGADQVAVVVHRCAHERGRRVVGRAVGREVRKHERARRRHARALMDAREAALRPRPIRQRGREVDFLEDGVDDLVVLGVDEEDVVQLEALEVRAQERVSFGVRLVVAGVAFRAVELVLRADRVRVVVDVDVLQVDAEVAELADDARGLRSLAVVALLVLRLEGRGVEGAQVVAALLDLLLADAVQQILGRAVEAPHGIDHRAVHRERSHLIAETPDVRVECLVLLLGEARKARLGFLAQGLLGLGRIPLKHRH